MTATSFVPYDRIFVVDFKEHGDFYAATGIANIDADFVFCR